MVSKKIKTLFFVSCTACFLGLSSYFSYFYYTSTTLDQSTQEDPQKTTLLIYNWFYYLPQEIIDWFTRETGIPVICDGYENQEALEAKLLTQCGYDIVFPPAWPVFARALQNNLVHKIDLKKIPNAQHIDPWFREQLSSIDPKGEYAMPYMWGTTGIGVDKKALRDALGYDAEIGWYLFFDPKISKILKKHKLRLSLLDSGVDVLQSVLIYLGHNPITEDQKPWDEAISLLANSMDVIDVFESNRQYEDFLNSNSQVIQICSSYGNMARIGSKNPNLFYEVPREGAMMWIDVMMIPKDAPHPELAHIFMNFILRPDVIARCSQLVRCFNAIPSSVKYMTKEERESLQPDKKVMKRLYSDAVLKGDLVRHISHSFLKIKMGLLLPSLHQKQS